MMLAQQPVKVQDHHHRQSSGNSGAVTAAVRLSDPAERPVYLRPGRVNEQCAATPEPAATPPAHDQPTETTKAAVLLALGNCL
jgi:hypothetical protein